MRLGAWVWTLAAVLAWGSVDRALGQVAPLPGQLVVNEFMTHGPAGGTLDLDFELIETGNTAVVDLELENCQIRYRPASGGPEAVLYTFPSGTTLAPGNYYTIRTEECASNCSSDAIY